jgi:hypothetical protein
MSKVLLGVMMIGRMMANQMFMADQGMVQKTTIGEIDPSVNPSRLDVNVDKDINEKFPNADPFIVMLNQSRTKPVDTTRFEFLDHRPMSWWTHINLLAGYDAAAASMVVDDASIVAPGMIIKIPRTGEEIRIGAVDIDTNTISSLTRGFGSTAAAAIVDDDDIMIMPNAMEEGYTTPMALSTQPEFGYNYVQTVSTPINLSEQADQVALRAGGSERNRLTRDALFQHRTGMERVAIFGERKRATVNNKVVLKTGGIISFLSSNVFNLGGSVLTEYDFDDICEQVFRAGSDTKVLVCGGLMQLAITRFAKERVTVSEDAKSYGLTLKEFTPATGGRLIIAKSKTFEEYYSGYGLIVDMKNVDIRYFNKTNLYKNQQNGTSHEFIDEYACDFGMEVRQESTHGLIKGMKTA